MPRSLPLLLCLAACNRDGAGEAASTTSITSASAPASGDGSSGDTGTSSSTSTSTSTGPDASTGAASTTTTTTGLLPDLPDFTGGQHPGCQGKIDFLFVVSRGSYMYTAQQQLAESFSGFIAAIDALGEQYAARDFHIMAVDTDKGWGFEPCNEDCTPEGCSIPDYPCDQLGVVGECEFTLGAGTIFNAGKYAPNEPCGLPALRRFVDGDHPSLLDTFACMATVGTSGYDDTIGALLAALSPENLAGCNQGFLRDDALLVITVISGNDEYMDSAEWEWANKIAAAKHGDKDAIVMLLVYPDESLEACLDDGYVRLCELLEEFPHRKFAPAALDDWSPAFKETVGLIDEVCAQFVPQ